jgi:TolB-like protein/lipoprotein NlpI
VRAVKKRNPVAVRKFWNELRRRHVVQVAVFYGAFAWIVIQVGYALLTAFELEHLERYLIAVLVCGFPVALLLSWWFDFTPGGIERTDPLPSLPAAPSGSLAVLPFVNLSDDAENEYFSDGLSEEIRNQLARVPGLRVAARTSSFSFKGRHQDVREIGRLLNVAVVLEGGVRKQADAVRINLQLVSASDGFQIWSEQFERKLEDIFRLQDEIAEAVMQRVSPLSTPAGTALLPATTQHFDAYNLYLRGRHHFHKRTEAALQRAVGYFKQAIECDANYALAYSGLADATMLLSSRYYGNMPVDEAVSKALPAAQRALELAPEQAEAHATLGLIRESQGDLAGAGQSLRRALELNPAYTMSLVWYGLVLVGQGNFREAGQRNREALQRDPLSPIINVNVGFDALRYGDIAQARTSFAAAIEIDPYFPVSHYGLARAHAQAKEFDPALHAIDAAIALAPERAYYHARKGLLLLQAGQLEAAGRSVEEACCKAPDNPFDADLIIANSMVRDDHEYLGKVARGETMRSYAAEQRGQAFIALGDIPAAREQYERAVLDGGKELIELITDDWIWRLPHVINRAHLRLLAGDARGRNELEQLLAGYNHMTQQEIVNPVAGYWAACAHALLGHAQQAGALLDEARRIGWHHPWWERQDWNIRALMAEMPGANAAGDLPEFVG